MPSDFDSMFEEYAKQEEMNSKALKSANSFQANYEKVKWTGLEVGVPSVLRFVGGPPNSNATPYTARTVNIARIIGDDGKQMRLIRPSFGEDPTYIINKIIQKVMAIKYVDGNKIYPNETEHPKSFNIVNKCGLEPTNSRYKYNKGWKGQEVIIANVIDRSKMDWHRQNKHTMLLAKSVNVDDQGNEWPDEGISAWATDSQFKTLAKYYKGWEHYDISIKRTGNMTNAYIIENACKNPERVTDGMDQYINYETELSEEERSWETYNLEDMYKVTSPIKIYNRLKETVKKIDKDLGTDFFTELKEIAMAEKARLDAENAKAETEKLSNNPQIEVDDVKHVEEVDVEPVVESRVSRTRELSNNGPIGSEMPYYITLSDVMKSKIKSCKKTTYTNDSGQTVDSYKLTWDYDQNDVLPCPICNTDAPVEVTKCPCCGANF